MPLGCRGIAVEDMLDHAAGELVLAEKDFPDVFFFEQRRFFFAMGAYDGLDARVDGAGDFDHAAHVQRIRRGDHQHARPLDMRLDQYIGIGSVPETAGMPLWRSFSTISRFSSATTKEMPLAVSASPMRRPTRP